MKPFRSLQAIALPAGKLLALLLLIVGCKLCLIRLYGASLPFFDQWPGEGAWLFQPWVHHQWHWSDLFAPFNLHRIAMTRLLMLGLFQWNGQWDMQVEMIASACIHAAVALCLGAILIRALGREWENAILICLALLFCLPFGWENTLSGFQSQFYFEILFSVLAIWGLAMHKPGSPRWWLGSACAVLAWFSVASGPLASLAVAAWMAVKLYRREHGAREHWTTLAMSIALSIGGVSVSIGVPQSAEYHARSIVEFAGVLGAFLSWPSLVAPCCVVVFFPFACLLWRRMRSRQSIPPEAAETFLFALGFWIILQACLVAYGRAHFGAGVPRYRDLFSPVALINFTCLLILVRELSAFMPRYRRELAALAFVWTGFMLASLGSMTNQSLQDELPYMAFNNGQQRQIVSEFESSNDASIFEGKRSFDLQCATGHFPLMIDILRDPAMRQIMSGLRPSLQLTPAEALNFSRGGALPDGSTAGDGWVSRRLTAVPVTRFRSAPIERCAPWLEFQVYGDVGTPDARLGLISRPGTEQEEITWVLPERTPGIGWRAARDPHTPGAPFSPMWRGWRTVLVKTPRTPFIVEATSEGGKDHVLAFRNPREVGPLSAFAQGLLADYPAALIFIGVGLWAALVLWEKWRHEDVASLQSALDLRDSVCRSPVPYLVG